MKKKISVSSSYETLATEAVSSRFKNLDLLPTETILRHMNAEDVRAAQGVRRVLKPIAQAARMAARSLRQGGSLLFIGAGTSGRLGVIEAAECPPTFGTSPRMVRAVMAGGPACVFRSREGTEDDTQSARRVVRREMRKGDVAVGIAASGVTPFVREALIRSRRAGAKTVLITCNAQSNLRHRVDVFISPQVGPEILAGSTRLKAGTATKMILNMITTSAMVLLGKTYGNRMVDLQPKSIKLRERAIRLVKTLGGVSSIKAKRLLRETRYKTKPAILMARLNISHRQAVLLLRRQGGFLRTALTHRP
ncbi:MAG TPA: N-acetylmuramic acid 6-phosphate etherase [Elusimicrobiota bacterium]|nr:N-acetylmuramic acid 6-phosphate etherase [Elusimicrobiota bacterium]